MVDMKSVAWSVVAALALLACSSDGEAQQDGSSPVTAAPMTTALPATTAVASSAPSTTDASTTTTPAAPASTQAPPTTAPLSGLILSDRGLGQATFGDDPEDVVAYVASLLGAPTADTGWLTDGQLALCRGDQYRSVEWGVIRLWLVDVSPFVEGRRHFAGWEYGLEGRLGEEPQGLITVDGVGLGTRVDELRAAFPDVEVYEGEEGLFPPSFYVNEEFDGFLTGETDADIVTVIFGGHRCGE
jgi:hypothetical protein